MDNTPTPSIINPFDIKNYNRTLEEKQMFIIFAMAVAGKEARQISFKVMDLIYNPILKDNKGNLLYESIKEAIERGEDPYKYFIDNTIGYNDNIVFDNNGILKTPFNILKSLVEAGRLDEELKRVKLGKYKLLNKGYSMLANNELELDTKKPLLPTVSHLNQVDFLFYTHLRALKLLFLTLTFLNFYDSLELKNVKMFYKHPLLKNYMTSLKQGLLIY